jgi:hypothetical protein
MRPPGAGGVTVGTTGIAWSGRVPLSAMGVGGAGASWWHPAA